MKRDVVMTVLQVLATARQNVDEAKRIVDEEALQVGDRNIIDHAMATITSEMDILAQTLRDILEDPTKNA
jgi:hypothetical protein